MRPGCEKFENVDVFYNEKTGELFIDDHESDEQLAEFRVTSDLIETIMEWGREKGIDNPQVQLKKLCEEALETQEAMAIEFESKWIVGVPLSHADARYHLKEEVGDIGVVWLLLCQALDIDPMNALKAAHEKNKDRKGRTVNGNFIKEEE